MSLKVDISKLTASLRNLTPRVAKAALEAGAQSIADDGDRAFNRPALRPIEWADYSPTPSGQRYKQRKLERGRSKMLIDEGFLARSIRVASVDEKRAEIVSDREYAAYHQFGTKKMPRRPFLPFANANFNAGEVKLTPDGEARAKAAMEAAVKSTLPK